MTLTIAPLSPALGAEVTGLDLTPADRRPSRRSDPRSISISCWCSANRTYRKTIRCAPHSLFRHRAMSAAGPPMDARPAATTIRRS